MVALLRPSRRPIWPTILFRPSASITIGRSISLTIRYTRLRVWDAVPKPGPNAMACLDADALTMPSNASSKSNPVPWSSSGIVIASVTWGSKMAFKDRGIASDANPAPPLIAEVVAIAAAPVLPVAPATIKAWPLWPLWVSGSRCSNRDWMCRPVTSCCPIFALAAIAGGIPMSITSTPPQCCTPG